MKIGISTACFYPYINTEDTLDIMKELGFDLCEVFLEAESEMNESFCYKFKNKAEKLGIKTYSIHAFNAAFEPFLFDRYKRRREEMEQKFIKICKAGSLLNAEFYTFHGITSVMNNGEIDVISDNISHLCDLAQNCSINLSQENVSWCRSSDPEYLSQIKLKNPDKLFYTLDIKQAVRAGRIPEEYLNVFQEKLSTIHINDVSEKSACLLPGKGTMNLKNIIETTIKLNPNAPFIIEVYRENYKDYKELGAAKEYLKKLEN